MIDTSSIEINKKAQDEYFEYIKARAEKNKKNIDDFLSINGLPIYPETERQNFFFIGSIGTGKTTGLMEPYFKLKKRLEKIVCYDYKGDYLEKSYNPEHDHIINPLDSRTIKWNLFNEIKSNNPLVVKLNIANICNSMIPDSQNPQDAYFIEGARVVLESIFKYIWNQKKKQDVLPQNVDLYEMLNCNGGALKARFEEDVFECGPALPFIDPPSSPHTGSILSMMKRFTKFVEYLPMGETDNFSFYEWVQNDEKTGTLFIENNPKYEIAIKGALSVAIEQIALGILSRPEYPKKTVYLFLDEYQTFQVLSCIRRMLQVARSRGASSFIATPSITSLDELYGVFGRRTIINCCATHFYFGVKDSYTAEELSKNIGNIEIMDESVTRTDGSSTTFAKRIRQAVLDSQFLDMENGEFYFNNPLTKNFFWNVNQSYLKNFKGVANRFIIKE